jgi:hypothetical protein
MSLSLLATSPAATVEPAPTEHYAGASQLRACKVPVSGAWRIRARLVNTSSQVTARAFVRFEDYRTGEGDVWASGPIRPGHRSTLGRLTFPREDYSPGIAIELAIRKRDRLTGVLRSIEDIRRCP